jgi:hypothetical protein
MTVWVFNTPQGDGQVDFVYASLQKAFHGMVGVM